MAKSLVSTLKALFHAVNVLIVWCLVVGVNDILKLNFWFVLVLCTIEVFNLGIPLSLCQKR